ncbi:MAG: MYXO-CTERM sorting domain-containing protein [Sandaracinaceae bacterium]
MPSRAARLVFAAIVLTLVPAVASAQPPSFINFESGPVRPLAMSADGTELYVVNVPDARLEIFDLTGSEPRLDASVGVGLEPVAVAVESPTRVWVVNHLSDSVSIVDVAASPPRVVNTLFVGDEPRDIVFAGPGRGLAFITSAHRGQNTATPDGQATTPGVGRADVWVFDADSVGTALGGAPQTVVTLFGDVPRALAVSPDGARVYAAVFFSGNRTTTAHGEVVCDGGAGVGPCNVGGVTYPGGLPAPNVSFAGIPGPEVGLIVRQTMLGGPWVDEMGRDWSAAVRFSLPDEDVFAIDAMAVPPAQTDAYAGVGTVLYGMAAHPVTGELFVANTEAHNEVRFEGPGTYVTSTMARPGLPPTVRGHLHEARITRIASGEVTPVALNPHLDYAATSFDADVRWRTLATPTALAFSGDGRTIYVSALGSSAIGVIPTSEVVAGTVSSDLSRAIPLRDPWPSGPVGLLVDDARGRLYALTRFDDSVVTIDLASRAVVGRTRMHSPEPAEVVIGRPVLYDAMLTSSNGEASCASCHVFGDNDQLAWDLGNPDDDALSNPNPIGVIGTRQAFNALKGPMTTQSLRGLANHGPMHWRGDRTAGHSGGDPLDERGAFMEFNVAFGGLLGRDEGPLAMADIGRFADFAMTITYPPNPIRQLDNSLRANEVRGRDIYTTRSGIDTVTTCNGCHVLNRATGFFGGDGRFTFEGETQHFKVPHLRNAYTKVGMFGMPQVPFFTDPGGFAATGPQVRGFGYLHDGSVDNVRRFLHASVFTGFTSEAERNDVAAFVLAFDSDLPPIVGQQVTLTNSSGTDALTRAQLLAARASAPMVWPGGATVTECDLVVRGVVAGEERGFLLEADGLFHSDRASEPARTQGDMLALLMPGQPMTLTCVPPGSGRRMAYDRDEDGVRDADERDMGTDPAGRAPIAIPSPPIEPPTMEMPDGGPPDLDAGPSLADAGPPGLDGSVIGSDGGSGADAGDPDTMEDGCGCRAAGAPARPAGAWLGAGLAALVFARGRRRKLH